jgi:hypothetical protein
MCKQPAKKDNTVHPKLASGPEKHENNTHTELCINNVRQTRGEQIPEAMSPWPLNIVRWRIMLVGSQNRICVTSPFWCLEF